MDDKSSITAEDILDMRILQARTAEICAKLKPLITTDLEKSVLILVENCIFHGAKYLIHELETQMKKEQH